VRAGWKQVTFQLVLFTELRHTEFYSALTKAEGVSCKCETCRRTFVLI
jgi:hypothetical protein